MARQLLALVTAAVLTLGAAPLLGHDEFQISGTIVSVGPSRLEVKTDDGRKLVIGLTAGTTIWLDKKKVSPTELKTGRIVVVDAYGDSEADCVAFEVHIRPAASSSPARR